MIHREEGADAEYLQVMYQRLVKFKNLSTGSESLDTRIKERYGEWLTPTEEAQALHREINVLEAKGLDTLDLKFKLKQRMARGLEVHPDARVSVRKIPYQDPKTGEDRFMKLRQLFLCAPGIGKLRITWVSRKDAYVIVDEVTRKKIIEVDREGIFIFLKPLIPKRDIDHLIMLLWS